DRLALRVARRRGTGRGGCRLPRASRTRGIGSGPAPRGQAEVRLERLRTGPTGAVADRNGGRSGAHRWTPERGRPRASPVGGGPRSLRTRPGGPREGARLGGEKAREPGTGA